MTLGGSVCRAVSRFQDTSGLGYHRARSASAGTRASAHP